MQSKTIRFFGPADLIQHLQKACWASCLPDGENFSAIGLGGYCLTRPADDLCPCPIKITIKKQGSKESFVVEGFCFRDTFLAIEKGPPAWEENKILGRKLLAKADKKNSCEYVMTVRG